MMEAAAAADLVQNAPAAPGESAAAAGPLAQLSAEDAATAAKAQLLVARLSAAHRGSVQQPTLHLPSQPSQDQPPAQQAPRVTGSDTPLLQLLRPDTWQEDMRVKRRAAREQADTTEGQRDRRAAAAESKRLRRALRAGQETQEEEEARLAAAAGSEQQRRARCAAEEAQEEREARLGAAAADKRQQRAVAASNATQEEMEVRLAAGAASKRRRRKSHAALEMREERQARLETQAAQMVAVRARLRAQRASGRASLAQSDVVMSEAVAALATGGDTSDHPPEAAAPPTAEAMLQHCLARVRADFGLDPEATEAPFEAPNSCISCISFQLRRQQWAHAPLRVCAVCDQQLPFSKCTRHLLAALPHLELLDADLPPTPCLPRSGHTAVWFEGRRYCLSMEGIHCELQCKWGWRGSIVSCNANGGGLEVLASALG
jgi:hypothetical protein